VKLTTNLSLVPGLRKRGVLLSLIIRLYPSSYFIRFAAREGGTLSVVVKRPGREAVHSSPSNAVAKNTWGYTSTAPIRLHGMVLS